VSGLRGGRCLLGLRSYLAWRNAQLVAGEYIFRGGAHVASDRLAGYMVPAACGRDKRAAGTRRGV